MARRSKPELSRFLHVFPLVAQVQRQASCVPFTLKQHFTAAKYKAETRHTLNAFVR